MNYTADLVAEELYKMPVMQDHVARTYSTAREDIFNVKIRELPEYSVLYKMLYKSSKLLDDYTKKVTNIDQSLLDKLSL